MEATYFQYNEVIGEVQSELAASFTECTTLDQLYSNCLSDKRKKRLIGKKKKAGANALVKPTASNDRKFPLESIFHFISLLIQRYS